MKYPLFKKDENNSKYLTPILSLRYSPNKGLNLINDNVLIKYEDLFSLDRIADDTIEAGAAATLGLEYKKIDNFMRSKIVLQQ